MLKGLETFFVKKPFSIWTQYALKLDLDCDTQIDQTYIFSLFCHMYLIIPKLQRFLRAWAALMLFQY